MEILQEDSFLREEILNDAKTKAERIIKKAERECEELDKNLIKEIDEFEKNYKEQVEKQIEEQKKLKFASIEIEVKKMYYQFCGEVIEEIFNEIKKWLSEKERYKDFYFKMIHKSIMELGDNKEVIVEIDETLSSIFKINELKSSLSNKEVIDIVKKDEIKGVFISTKDNKLGIYISLDSFIERLKEEERVNIYNLLLK